MLDAKLLRNNLAEVSQTLRTKRGFILDQTVFLALEEKRKALQVELQLMQNERNVRSKSIGIAKSKGENITALCADLETAAMKMQLVATEYTEIQTKLHAFCANIPNLPLESVPAGKNETDNLEIRRVGTPRSFDFTPKDHVTIGESLGLMDFAAAAKISGARFVVLHDGLARLQRALIQFMLDLHTKTHGYHEVYVPYLVNETSMYGTGQLPKFREDHFFVAGDFKLSLIPTAEVPVTNLARDMIYENKELPQKYVAYTPCFRSEAGSYGKDTRGMIRNHQFEKVELVRFERPENSEGAHEALTRDAEAVLQKLGLPYRVVALCGGDLGFSAAKTYDLEVWLPSQNGYREISSCSNFTDFQARRLQARWRNPATGKPELLHTLNGSGLAVGRTLVAILENYQNAEGNVEIPEVLCSYMEGLKMILKKN